MVNFNAQTSYWPHEKTYYAQRLQPCQQYISKSTTVLNNAAVVIVGAGLAGLNMALGLLERGAQNVLVLEAGKVASGASGRNGGFIMSGFSRSPEWLVHRYGKPMAKALYQQTLLAQQQVKERIGRYQINCDLRANGIVLANQFRYSKALSKCMGAANALGAGWQYLSVDQLSSYVRSPRYYDAVLEIQGAHCQPLAYALGLARQVEKYSGQIVEQAKVISVSKQANPKKGWVLKVEHQNELHTVTTEQLVIANGSNQGILSALDQAVLPITTFIGVTEPLAQIDEVLPSKAAVYDNRFAFDYYRKLPDKRLLWGGRISITKPRETTIRKRLAKDIKRVFPNLETPKIDYAWGGFMAYFCHQMPVAQRLDKSCWVINGFGGHGLAQTTMAAELLIDEMLPPEAGGARYPHLHGSLASGLPKAYGRYGLLAAQLTYWRYQTQDFLRL